MMQPIQESRFLYTQPMRLQITLKNYSDVTHNHKAMEIPNFSLTSPLAEGAKLRDAKWAKKIDGI